MIEVVTRSAHPHDVVLGYVERLGRWADVSMHASARVRPGVVVYRMDDRLLFANARYFKGRIQEADCRCTDPYPLARVRWRRSHRYRRLRS